MTEAASAHQAATATHADTSQQRTGRTRRTSADPQRAQQGATAAAAPAPAALDSLSRLQQLADASSQVAQLRRLQALADAHYAPVSQLAGTPEEEELIQGKFATVEFQPRLQQAPRTKNTGLPDQLKSGIESLSGLSMDDVRVHYNSSQPAQLNALAYAQGSDIHLGPGQERHLGHEAWHVVQQRQGRVKAAMQLAGIGLNDDARLEREADLMGWKEMSAGVAQGMSDGWKSTHATSPGSVVQAQPVVQLYDWLKSTPLATIWSFLTSPSYEGAKDLVDPRRSRLNPLNLIEGARNYGEEMAGGNYHSSSRHGAHNTVGNSSARLIGAMDNHYTGGLVGAAHSQSRFNSEAWESFSWRKAKELFAADIGVPVTWVAGPLPANTRSSWNVCLNHAGSDVGISQPNAAAAIVSVSGVRVAVNYQPTAGGGGGVDACNGQMYPTAPAAPPAGAVRAGHPVGGMNGTIQAIPYQFLGYFGI